MARRVGAAGFELAAWNRTAGRATQFRDSLPAGTTVRMAATAAEAVRGADVVISCLPTSANVMSVLDAAHGVAAALTRGAAWVDCTSGDPPTSRQIAADLGAHGVAYIDAPVSGGTSGADNGTLTVMCGGDAAVIERVRPVAGVVRRQDRALRSHRSGGGGESGQQRPARGGSVVDG